VEGVVVRVTVPEIVICDAYRRLYNTIQQNTIIQSPVPHTIDRRHRTMLVCVKGMLTKIERLKFAPKSASVRDGFEFSG